MTLVDAVWIGLERDPDIGRRIGMKIVAQDADQSVRVAVQSDGPADHVGVAAPMPFPQAMTDDGQPRPAGPVFILAEGASREGSGAEDREKFG